MSDYHIGRLIRGFRESKNISRKALYYGLKDVRLVSKMENGEQEMSKLLVDVLLERMGLSTDMYGYVFTIKEYERFQTRADILEALEKGDYIEAESLCKDYENMIDKRDKLEKQFMRTMHLLIAMEKGAEPEYLLEEAKEILFLTVPKFNIRNINEYMLSGIERMLIAVQAEMYCRMEDTEEQGMDIYYRLFAYLEEYCTDYLERERQIPPLVLLIVKWLWKWEQYSEMWICEKGISILRNNMRLSLLEPIMEYEIKAWEKGEVVIPVGEKVDEWKHGLEALEILNKEYKIEGKYPRELKEFSLFALMIRQTTRGQILGEVIKRIRAEKKMTIEELAIDICEPENLRRIEMGIIKPRERTYYEIMKKLGQQEYAFHPMICSDDYRMYECCQEINQYVHKAEYEKAEYVLRKLESGLDFECKTNRQIFLGYYGVIKGRTRKIALSERLDYLKCALKMTVPDDVKLESFPLNREETILWNNMATTLELMGEREQAILLLKRIKESYEQNRVRQRSYQDGYMMILSNLSSLLGREKRYNEAFEITSYGIKLALEWKQGKYLNLFLYNKIWITEKKLEEKEESKEAIKKICIPLLKQNFNIASVTKHTFYINHIRKHCKEYYGITLDEVY